MSIKRFFRWYFFIPIALVGIPLFLALLGEIVKLLWNALLPPLFGWPVVSFWQALGLLALCRILFGGIGPGRGYRSHRSPEERERLRQLIRARVGLHGPGRGHDDPIASDPR
jgi:hypothetical protein